MLAPSVLGGRNRQRESHDGAPIDFALRIDTAAMGLDETAGDSQPETAAGRVLAFAEALEDVWQVVGRNAASGICNAEGQGAAPVCRRRNGDGAAGGRVPERVGEDVR